MNVTSLYFSFQLEKPVKKLFSPYCSEDCAVIARRDALKKVKSILDFMLKKYPGSSSPDAGNNLTLEQLIAAKNIIAADMRQRQDGNRT